MPIADMLTLVLAQIPSPSPSPTTPPVLTWNQTLIVVVISAVAVLLAGLIVILARVIRPPRSSEGNVIRSWIAISLVMALVLFTAASFAVADSSLRNTLIGAIAASVGSAVAHYFSSRSADQANQTLLDATSGTSPVPDLVGMDEQAAATALGKAPFQLVVNLPRPAGASVVATQDPKAGSTARNGSAVRVTLGPPPSNGR